MWISLSLQTDAEHAERLSEVLMEHGALSVSIEDADAGTDAERPQFGEPGHLPDMLWDHSRVVVLFDATISDGELDRRLTAAALEAGLDAVPPYGRSELAEQDWVQLTQSQFDPIRINERLWIVPSWHDAPDPAAINIELDPGMAFGTGSHATTRLCLQWLSTAVQPGCSMLDYGCGSGILGIAAARMGATEVLGVDIDPKALEAARDNIRRNRVKMQVQLSTEELNRPFDLVVANILTNPLCVLAPAIAACVAPGGKVALSGILEPQAGQVIAAWAPYVALQIGASDEGWVRLEGQRATS